MFHHDTKGDTVWLMARNNSLYTYWHNTIVLKLVWKNAEITICTFFNYFFVRMEKKSQTKLINIFVDLDVYGSVLTRIYNTW